MFAFKTQLYDRIPVGSKEIAVSHDCIIRGKAALTNAGRWANLIPVWMSSVPFKRHLFIRVYSI